MRAVEPSRQASRKHSVHAAWLGLATAFLTPALAIAQAVALQVVEVRPNAHTLHAAPDAPIEVRFDRAVDRSTVDTGSFWAFGRWSGAVSGVISFAAADSVIRITPAAPLAAGERVIVVVSNHLRGADGAAIRNAGYSFRYWTRSIPAKLEFTQIAELTTRDDPTQSTRAYGGFAANLNADRLLDLGIVNEVTADVRFFLNDANTATHFETFLQPPVRVGQRASPSETGDFDRDGNMDVCIANIDENSVSILMGRGNGGFQARPDVTVGLTPRGIAVLDMDGDGDADIATANFGSDNVSLLLNDGRGNFLASQTMDAGGAGEWAIEAEDMDDDGILDLVVGCQNSRTVHVNRGLGDGTFEHAGSAATGGRVWMLNCGDVDGDQREDVVVVNSSDNHGAVLLGNGRGQLGTPTLRATDDFPLASDLADLDGDGDLDWVTSSFNGDWLLFTNDGGGGFELQQRFAAPRAASCSIPFDLDDDGDVDLALVDEMADVVLIYENTGTSTAVERRNWGRVKALFGR